jgi:bacterioferritin-associated ferredoxin
MYVCICNAIRDREIAVAAESDAASVAEIFRRCGRRPQCGKCLPDVAQMIEDRRDRAHAVPLAAE